MRYKILLAGKSQIVIDDFFNTMSEDFECMSTSIRSEDIINHIHYFQPDAFVYCITSETRENTLRLIEALETAGKKNPNLNIILLGDRDSCSNFTQLRPEMVNLTLFKPITATIIREQIIKFLEGKQLPSRLEGEKQSEPDDSQETMRKVQAVLKQGASESLSEPENANIKHILVIDDDPMMLRLIKTELKDEYNVATAVSGKVALNFLQRKKTDLILLDYEMPEENGPEVLKKLRADENTKNIPVVFLTGISDRAKIKKVVEMKPQGYLLKPINHDKLIQTIHKVIG